jgi:hypothetical protein
VGLAIGVEVLGFANHALKRNVHKIDKPVILPKCHAIDHISPKRHAIKIFCQSVMPQKYFAKVSCHKNILPKCHAIKIFCQSVMP